MIIDDDPTDVSTTKFVAKKILSHEDYLIANDSNGDGYLSVDDCTYPAGSVQAKMWIRNVLDPFIKNSITPEMREMYGSKVKGAYLGNPIVPGELGSYDHPQGDMDLLIDKIRLLHDVDYVTAYKIVQKLIEGKYGVK